MPPYTKHRHVTTANYPRNVPWSTNGSTSTLQLVYDIYETTGSPTKVDDHCRINLIFLHGNGFSKEVWDYMIENFFEEFGDILGTVIAVDAVNHNDSYKLNKSKLGWTYDWRDGSKDIVKLAKELNLPGATILVGHSMGATQSLYAGYIESELFDSIVAIDPVVYQPMYEEAESITPKDEKYANILMQKLYKKMQDQYKNEDDYYKTMTEKSIYKEFHPKLLRPFLDANKVENPDGTVNFSTPAIQQMICFMGGNYIHKEIKHQLQNLDVEVLHLAGDVPGIISPKSTPWARQNLKRVIPADIPKGTHMVAFENPHDTFDKIKPFIRRRYEILKTQTEAVHRFDHLPLKEREQFVTEQFHTMLKTYPKNKLHSKL